MKLILLTFLLCASGLAASPLTIVLARATAVEAGFVSLAQIATLTGDDAEAAGRVLLGRAPGAAQSRGIEIGFIRTRLSESGIDARNAAFYGYMTPIVHGAGFAPPADSGEYVAPPKTEQPHDGADTVSATVPEADSVPVAPKAPAPLDALVAEALERITDQLTRQFGHLGTLHVAETSRSRALGGLQGRMLRLTEVTTRQRVATLGRLDYRLAVEVDGQPVHGLTLTVKAELERPVVVARRVLTRGTVISAEDVELRTERSTSVADAGFSQLEAATDLETRNTVQIGEALSAANTRPALLIRRGDVVRVRVELPGGGAVQVTATAQEEGAKGDVIRLRRNIEGARPTDLTGRVTGRGECAAE